MQIDGHYTGTYVAARVAGFSHSEAHKIAYAAQYVDDADNEGVIFFRDSEYLYCRIASAHKALDYQNLLEPSNHLVWLPFHFLPGNGGLPANEEPANGEHEKLICRPDSHVARDMLRSCLADKGRSRELHRLGIAMHVYADTFSHQNFVGALHRANKVTGLGSDDKSIDVLLQGNPISAAMAELGGSIRGFLRKLIQWVLTAFFVMRQEGKGPLEYWKEISADQPLGHATAGSYPDLPFLVWHYRNGKNEPLITRDNPSDFLTAVDMMTRAMQAWRNDDESMDLMKYEGLGAADRAVVSELFSGLRAIEGEERRLAWEKAIREGRFSFGPAEPHYIGKGKDSWKHQALNTEKEKDAKFERYPYSEHFLESDWKLFHDALQVHRSAIVHDILPRYKICAA